MSEKKEVFIPEPDVRRVKNAATNAEPSAAVMAEIATKAIYTHGFGFNEVCGPAERNGKHYATLCLPDGRTARLCVWLEDDE